jgi:thiamine kinase-like enzyme
MDKPLQPETALNSWRQWSGELRSRPIILKPLSGGRSNHSFLLNSDGKKMVLRLNGAETLLPGANRSSEIKIWQVTSTQGIAPPLLYVDNQNRFLISTYINNSLPPQPPIDETFVDQAFNLLKIFHQLDTDAPTIDYASHIENYWQIIERKSKLLNPLLNEQRKPMQEVLATLTNSGTAMGLCHHDLVIANFVGNADRLYLIDWEYAAHGLQVMDYAALSIEWGIDDAVVIERTGIELELLIMAKTFYKYMCSLWAA